MTFRKEKWKDGWLWIQTTPNGRWDTALATEVIASLAERVTKLERPAEAVEPAAFEPEAFAGIAELLRRYTSDDKEANRHKFRAVCSNNLNIILAALDKASEDLT